MPSPVGHALGGLIAGGLLRPARAAQVEGGRTRASWHVLATMALLGTLPDIDFLIGRHSRESHSIGAVVVVGLVAWLVARRRTDVGRAFFSGHSPARWAVACALAYASHLVLDWLGSDTSPPIGIQALWPFSPAFYQSDLRVFFAVDRRFWLPGFATNAVLMLVWELVVLTPLAGMVCWLHGLRPTTNDQ